MKQLDDLLKQLNLNDAMILPDHLDDIAGRFMPGYIPKNNLDIIY